jgi:hypothetical protein
MPFRPVRPNSIAASWSRRLGRFAVLLALMALVLHRVGTLEMPNAIAAVLLSAVIAVFVLGLSIIGFFMLWHIGAKGGHASFSGMVMALIILIPVGLAASRFVLLPRIHDVTTDIADPPQWLEPPRISPPGSRGPMVKTRPSAGCRPEPTRRSPDGVTRVRSTGCCLPFRP